jgi:hypothetical protein
MGPTPQELLRAEGIGTRTFPSFTRHHYRATVITEEVSSHRKEGGTAWARLAGRPLFLSPLPISNAFETVKRALLHVLTRIFKFRVEWDRLSFLGCSLAVECWCDSIKLERSTYPAVGFADTLAVTGMKLGMVGAAAGRCRQRARLSNLRCGFGSALRRLLVRALQFSIKTRLAHSACFAAIALQKTMTTGWTMENRAAHCVSIRDDDCFRPALGALRTDDSVTPDAESGHSPPRDRLSRAIAALDGQSPKSAARTSAVPNQANRSKKKGDRLTRQEESGCRI